MLTDFYGAGGLHTMMPTLVRSSTAARQQQDIPDPDMYCSAALHITSSQKPFPATPNLTTETLLPTSSHPSQPPEMPHHLTTQPRVVLSERDIRYLSSL
jgi:hypothetical protein